MECSLVPKFGPVCNQEWTSNNVLDCCSHFFTNPWTDRHTYITIYFVPGVASKNTLYLIGNYSIIIGGYMNLGNLLVIHI
jgi:hypothetical protein